jgi:hypothetical protein
MRGSCEVKFDGWPAQLHKTSVSSAIYRKNGDDLTRRFPRIAAAVLGLPGKSLPRGWRADRRRRRGQPDFLAPLHGRRVPTCIYALE